MKNDFLIRAVSSAVIALITVFTVVMSIHTLLFLLLVVAGFSVTEFLCLSGKTEKAVPLGLWGMIPVAVGLFHILITYLVVVYRIPSVWFGAVVPMLFLIFFLQLYRKEGDPFTQIGRQVLALVYIPLPLSLLLWLGTEGGGAAETVYNWPVVLAFIVMIWVNDVGAYLSGVSFGKRKLFERLSPKKSWEGFWGGFILTVLAAGALGYGWVSPDKTRWTLWFFTGAVVSLSAVAGDLIESMFKRAVGVKDSGRTIPGHGGFLDRFDAMLFAIPFAYFLLRLW